MKAGIVGDIWGVRGMGLVYDDCRVKWEVVKTLFMCSALRVRCGLGGVWRPRARAKLSKPRGDALKYHYRVIKLLYPCMINNHRSRNFSPL